MPHRAIPLIRMPALHIKTQRQRRMKVQLAHDQLHHHARNKQTQQPRNAPLAHAFATPWHQHKQQRWQHHDHNRRIWPRHKQRKPYQRHPFRPHLPATPSQRHPHKHRRQQRREHRLHARPLVARKHRSRRQRQRHPRQHPPRTPQQIALRIGRHRPRHRNQRAYPAQPRSKAQHLPHIQRQIAQHHHHPAPQQRRLPIGVRSIQVPRDPQTMPHVHRIARKHIRIVKVQRRPPPQPKVMQQPTRHHRQQHGSGDAVQTSIARAAHRLTSSTLPSSCENPETDNANHAAPGWPPGDTAR